MTPRDLLDPEIAAGDRAIPFDDVTAEILPTLRAASAIELPLSDAVERTDHVVPGDPDVPVRVHRPRGRRRRAAVRVLDARRRLRDRQQRHGRPVVRRAVPEARLSSACRSTTGSRPRRRTRGRWRTATRDCAGPTSTPSELGIDPGRIGVMGVSAGGGLAAALALLARDRGEVPVAFQLLDSPMLDDRQITPSSRQDGLPVWSRDSNTFGWKAYLGDLYGRDDVPATAAPARATDLSGLPPAFVSVGAVDGFRDEDVDYALRLNQAGVPTELHVYPGACHGFNVIAPEAPGHEAVRARHGGLAAPRQLRRRG